MGHMELSTFLGTRFPWGRDQLFQIPQKQLTRVRGTVPAFRTYHFPGGLQWPCGSCGTTNSYTQGQGHTDAYFMMHWAAFWAWL